MIPAKFCQMKFTEVENLWPSLDVKMKRLSKKLNLQVSVNIMGSQTLGTSFFHVSPKSRSQLRFSCSSTFIASSKHRGATIKNVVGDTRPSEGGRLPQNFGEDWVYT
jgi:hypothetical protein